MSDKLEILGTGLSGLVGSKVVELLSPSYQFSNLDLSHGVDITNREQVTTAIETSLAPVVLHMAGFTDVNAAEQQAGDKSGTAYQVNVEGTRNVALACQSSGKYLINISTGYVFDGQKTSAYLESDIPNPIDWYSQNKLEAEEIINSALPNDSVNLRINFPYRKDAFVKKDLWHKISAVLEDGKNGPFFTDHFYTLTPVEWLAEVIDWAIQTRPTGVYHATTDTVYTDFKLAQEVAKSMGIDRELLGGSLNEYNRTAARKYAPSLILSNEKLKHAMQNWK